MRKKHVSCPQSHIPEPTKILIKEKRKENSDSQRALPTDLHRKQMSREKKKEETPPNKR